jgi:hypothetical protein
MGGIRVVPAAVAPSVLLSCGHRGCCHRQIVELGRCELALVRKRDSDHRTHSGLMVEDRQCNGSLRIYSFGAWFHIPGIILFEITGLNGFFPLQRKSRHALTVRNPGYDLLNRWRNIDGTRQPQSAVFEEVNGPGGSVVLCKETLKPAIQCSGRTHDVVHDSAHSLMEGVSHTGRTIREYAGYRSKFKLSSSATLDNNGALYVAESGVPFDGVQRRRCFAREGRLLARTPAGGTALSAQRSCVYRDGWLTFLKALSRANQPCFTGHR